MKRREFDLDLAALNDEKAVPNGAVREAKDSSYPKSGPLDRQSRLSQRELIDFLSSAGRAHCFNLCHFVGGNPLLRL